LHYIPNESNERYYFPLLKLFLPFFIPFLFIRHFKEKTREK